MHARHHSEVVGRSHDGFPVVVGIVNRGQSQRFRVLGEGEGRHPPRRHALHLLGGERRIPHGDEHQRDVASWSRTAPLLDEPVVVVLKAFEAELAIAGLHEQLPAEPGDGRKAQRGKHTGSVHILEARRGVVATRPHLRVRQWLGTELLLGLADDGAQSRIGIPLTVVDPHVHPVVAGFHVGRLVTVLRRNAVDPQVRRFENMVVDGDQPVQIDVGAVVFSDSTTCVGDRHLASSPIDMCLTS